VKNFKIRRSPAAKNIKTAQVAHGTLEIYDPVRKKYVALTPEEKIRQHTIFFLNSVLHYPYGCMGVECGLRVNDMFFRTDIVIRNKKAEVVMIVECKQQEVILAENVEEQILKYYQGHRSARFLLLTNGIGFRCWQISDNVFTEINEIPSWKIIE
jgi:hypothetical protein